ncbi:DUF3304 domain-containing protein [Collimonas sp. OK412]|jgi:hypothetical protein|uniref:DUF3304 domain-containing protein n=1 Tax=Collimonas sp. (strain OK412) TaxID=1801619 RepID=UPI0008E1E22D|nr:DUF3304 domain-containing protein [Collimonas sp. OK412]SFB83706.1 Protein of unknown function [Collimonas sp. OK412]
MTNSFFKFALLRWLLPTLIAILLSGCATRGVNGMAPEGQTPVSISSVVHYGKGIGIAEFYVNGRRSGSQYDGWGSSGNSCCLNLPDKPSMPLMVTVRWKTYRTNFKEERWHEATVPVHFSVPLGDGDGMKVHFLPGHRVEVWYARIGLWDPEYPGPPYPRPPAPDYVPLADEKPEPTRRK